MIYIYFFIYRNLCFSPLNIVLLFMKFNIILVIYGVSQGPSNTAVIVYIQLLKHVSYQTFFKCLGCHDCFLFFLSYFIYSRVFYSQLTFLIQPDCPISVHCQVSVRAQYLVKLLSLCWITGGMKFTHLLKDCYSQRVLNLRRSEILPAKQLDYNCILLHHTTKPAYNRLKDSGVC